MLRLVPFECLFSKLSVFPFSETWLQISLRISVCFASHADVLRASSRVPPPRISGGIGEERERLRGRLLVCESMNENVSEKPLPTRKTCYL